MTELAIKTCWPLWANTESAVKIGLLVTRPLQLLRTRRAFREGNCRQGPRHPSRRSRGRRRKTAKIPPGMASGRFRRPINSNA